MNTYEILSHLYIEALNGMQQEMHEACRRHDNVILLSPTGSGKTLAYLIPVVQAIDTSLQDVQALVLVPSRELAMQTAAVLRDMRCGVRGLAVYGGRPAMDEHRNMKGVLPHIIIGTPGRVLDHLQKENIDPSHITRLIIDEFDKSLELGFQDEMSAVMDHLKQVKSRFLLSATECPQIPLFMGPALEAHKLNFIDEEEQIPDRIEVRVVRSKVKDKLECLASLLMSLGQESSVVFVGFRESVDRTAKYLMQQGFSVSAFHGGMDQPNRERALFRFSSGACNIMVCTDLASRGLDIPEIDNVIHYHLPLDEQAYVHRNGRTARWDAQGNAFILLGSEEFLPEFVAQDLPTYDPNIQKHYTLAECQPKWESLYIGRGKKDKLSRGDIAGFMIKTGGLERDEVGRIEVRDHCAYVSVSRSRVKELVVRVRGQKIKGMKTIIEVTR